MSVHWHIFVVINFFLTLPSLFASYRANSEARADGDVDLELNFENFQLPCCPTCNGRLQPGVVMFGDNVPSHVTKHAAEAVANADGILVAGTSLQVFSAYKWVLQATSQNIPIAIVNIGPTRADELAQLKIESRLGDILPKIFHDELLPQRETYPHGSTSL